MDGPRSSTRPVKETFRVRVATEEEMTVSEFGAEVVASFSVCEDSEQAARINELEMSVTIRIVRMIDW